jgi:hypothetical protein
MSEMIERVEDAIYTACDYALPPHLLRNAAIAAIEAVADGLEARAAACQFISDQEAILCAVEELDEALGKVAA